MEQLTKQQVVLLCLLVCLVSSVATGTVVVSLSDQPIPSVSQTVNHVIERVMENSSPSQSPTGGSVSAPIKETVIVKDDQAVVDAIALASKSIIRMTAAPNGSPSPNGSASGYVPTYVGLGVIVSSSGKVVTAVDVGSGAQTSKSFFANLDGGNVEPLYFVSTDAATGLSIFQIQQYSDPASAKVYSPAVLGDSDSLRLGQSVVAISGSETPSVASGIISSLVQKPAADPSSAGVSEIKATLGGADSFDTRAVLVNLLGEVVGLQDSTKTIGDSASFTPSNIIKTYATP